MNTHIHIPNRQCVIIDSDGRERRMEILSERIKMPRRHRRRVRSGRDRDYRLFYAIARRALHFSEGFKQRGDKITNLCCVLLNVVVVVGIYNRHNV